jgi:uncharacterized protein YjbI with pentapeptide repeats
MENSLFFDAALKCDLTRGEILQMLAASQNHYAVIDLSGAQLCGIDLRRLRIRRLNFTDCDLRNANFAGADLGNTGTALHSPSFAGADVEGATFNRHHDKLLTNALNVDKAIFI